MSLGLLSKMVAEPRHFNITGAPFSIGNQVKVIKLIDSTALSKNLNQCGVIEYYEYNCGCGQTFPSDPMIGVRLNDGTLDEFWKEELQAPDFLSRFVVSKSSERK